MVREFRSKFAGTCRKCAGFIQIGDPISWDRSAAKGAKSWHKDCANPRGLEASATSSASAEAKTEVTSVVETGAIEDIEDIKEASTMADNGLGKVLAEAIKPYIDQKVTIDRKEIEAIVAEKLKDFEAPTMRIEVFNAELGTVKQIDGVQHKLFPKCLYIVNAGHHLYLWGPPGSGKSHIARQIAEALDRTYGYISLNPMTPDSRLVGFVDANGVIRETDFIRAYRDGGIYCVDEADNMSPSMGTAMNSSLENGYASFPCGMVKKHDNFVLVATGNTAGRGGNRNHAERRAFDGAFGERFTFLHFGYDEKLEKALALAVNPDAIGWLAWVRSVRAFSAERFPNLIVSPRASIKGARYLMDNVLTPHEIADAVVFKGLDKTATDAILRACPITSLVKEAN